MTLPSLGFAGRADAVSALVVLGLTGGTIARCPLVGLSLAWAPTRLRPLEVLRYA